MFENIQIGKNLTVVSGRYNGMKRVAENMRTGRRTKTEGQIGVRGKGLAPVNRTARRTEITGYRLCKEPE